MYRQMTCLLALFVFIACGAPAGAQDTDLHGHQHNWTGVYAGAQIGASRIELAEGVSIRTAPVGGGQQVSGSDSNTAAGSAFVIGGHFGGMYQLGAIVVGAEGRFDWASHSGDDDDCRDCHLTSLKWLGAAIAKLGITNERWLIYGSVGAAWARVDAEVPPDLAILAPSLTTESFRGIAYGGGLSYAFSRQWRVTADYLRYDMREVSSRYTNPDGANINHDQDLTFDTFSVRVSYQFAP